MIRSVTLKGMASAFTMAVVLVPAGLWSLGIPPPLAVKPVPPPPPITVIRNMSELATVKVHVSDFIEGENRHYKGRWNLHGEVVLGVDLSAARYAELHHDTRQATLCLPPPRLIASKVDHDRSEEVWVKAVAWLPVSSKKALRDAVWKQADRKIQRLGEDAGHLGRAKEQAELVLKNLFSGVGWKVRFRWQERQPAA